MNVIETLQKKSAPKKQKQFLVSIPRPSWEEINGGKPTIDRQLLFNRLFPESRHHPATLSSFSMSNNENDTIPIPMAPTESSPHVLPSSTISSQDDNTSQIQSSSSLQKVTIKEKEYIYDPKTFILYTMKSFVNHSSEMGKLDPVGKLIKTAAGYKMEML